MAALSGTASCRYFYCNVTLLLLMVHHSDKGEVFVCGTGCGRLGLDGEQGKSNPEHTEVANQKIPRRVEALRGLQILQVACGMISTIVLVLRPSP